MYYNLTEDQKIFLETSYSMIKAGYTLEEVEGFWSSEDEDNVKNILESVDYVDIDRKDADLKKLWDRCKNSWWNRSCYQGRKNC